MRFAPSHETIYLLTSVVEQLQSEFKDKPIVSGWLEELQERSDILCRIVLGLKYWRLKAREVGSDGSLTLDIVSTRTISVEVELPPFPDPLSGSFVDPTIPPSVTRYFLQGEEVTGPFERTGEDAQ